MSHFMRPLKWRNCWALPKGAPTKSWKWFARKTPEYRVFLGMYRTLMQSRLADGVGFEPTRRSHACRFSRPVPSTTRAPIHIIFNVNSITGTNHADKQSKIFPSAEHPNT